MVERSAELEAVVRSWLTAKQAGEVEGIRRALSSYDGALVIGTDGQEWWPGSRFTEAG